jgi:hypothetical protein
MRVSLTHPRIYLRTFAYLWWNDYQRGGVMTKEMAEYIQRKSIDFGLKSVEVDEGQWKEKLTDEDEGGEYFYFVCVSPDEVEQFRHLIQRLNRESVAYGGQMGTCKFYKSRPKWILS